MVLKLLEQNYSKDIQSNWRDKMTIILISAAVLFVLMIFLAIQTNKLNKKLNKEINNNLKKSMNVLALPALTTKYKLLHEYANYDVWACRHCGHNFYIAKRDANKMNYCQKCGREIISKEQ